MNDVGSIQRVDTIGPDGSFLSLDGAGVVGLDKVVLKVVDVLRELVNKDGEPIVPKQDHRLSLCSYDWTCFPLPHLLTLSVKVKCNVMNSTEIGFVHQVSKINLQFTLGLLLIDQVDENLQC